MPVDQRTIPPKDELIPFFIGDGDSIDRIVN